MQLPVADSDALHTQHSPRRAALARGGVHHGGRRSQAGSSTPRSGALLGRGRVEPLAQTSALLGHSAGTLNYCETHGIVVKNNFSSTSSIEALDIVASRT